LPNYVDQQVWRTSPCVAPRFQKRDVPSDGYAIGSGDNRYHSDAHHETPLSPTRVLADPEFLGAKLAHAEKMASAFA